MKGIHTILILAVIAAWTPHGMAQQTSSSFELGSIATPRTINPAANSTTPSSLAGQQQNPFLGSVPTGTLSDKPVELSLSDAINRGLHYNLGVIENQAGLRQAQAQRLRALSTMIPSVSALLRQNLNDLNTIAIGLKIPGIAGRPGSVKSQAHETSKEITKAVETGRSRIGRARCRSGFSCANFPILSRIQ